MVDRRASFHVDLGALQGTLQAGVQTTIQRVSFGLLAGRQATIVDEPDLPDTDFCVRLGTPPGVDDAKADHENWTLGNGLRDCAEALNTFLDSCHEVCALYSFGPKAKILGEDWNKVVVEGGRQFKLLGLARKLDWLRKEYSLEIDADTSSDLLTINAARNCLVHRHGLVQQVDKNSDEGLLVQWTRPELEIEGLDGTVRRLAIPEKVSAGENISFAQNKAHKIFGIGDRVHFDAQEFSELCWTYYIAGTHIVKTVEEYGRAKGIKFRERNATG